LGDAAVFGLYAKKTTPPKGKDTVALRWLQWPQFTIHTLLREERLSVKSCLGNGIPARGYGSSLLKHHLFAGRLVANPVLQLTHGSLRREKSASNKIDIRPQL